MVALGTVGQQGGKLQSADGRVSVEFPADAVPQDNVTINRRAKGIAKADSSRPGDDQHLVRFDLEAKGVTRFNKPVTLTVDLKELVDLNSLPEDVRPYLAYRSPDHPDEWISVPIRANWDENTISAQVEHFSDWQARKWPSQNRTCEVC